MGGISAVCTSHLGGDSKAHDGSESSEINVMVIAAGIFFPGQPNVLPKESMHIRY